MGIMILHFLFYAMLDSVTLSQPGSIQPIRRQRIHHGDDKHERELRKVLRCPETLPPLAAAASFPRLLLPWLTPDLRRTSSFTSWGELHSRRIGTMIVGRRAVRRTTDHGSWHLAPTATSGS